MEIDYKWSARKRCQGRLMAWCEDPPSPIHWACHDCGEGGIIYDWQGTIFDESALRKEREIEYEKRGVWIGGRRLDEMCVPLEAPPGTLHSWRAGLNSSVSSFPDGGMCLSMPAALLAELYRQKLISEETGALTLKLGQGRPKHGTLKKFTCSTEMHSMVKAVVG